MTRIKGITQKREISFFLSLPLHATKCGIKTVDVDGGGETVDIELKRRQAVKCQEKAKVVEKLFRAGKFIRKPRARFRPGPKGINLRDKPKAGQSKMSKK